MSGAALVLFVSRCPKPLFSYRWEIRHFTHGAVLERATKSYMTEAEARQVGETVMAMLEHSA